MLLNERYRERVRRKDLSLTERVIDSVMFHYNKLRFPKNEHIIDSKDLQLVTEGFDILITTLGVKNK